MTNQEYITVTGARQHNLKNISIKIPKNKLVVFTGLSGSGKSSLAFDTLYAEGQRRYVESLSSYARQFLGVMGKPDLDHIEGLSPAISIDQKTTSHNPRSTVGTITEIYDYLRLLFARVGHPHCPNCGREVSPQSIDQIIESVFMDIEKRSQHEVIRLMVLSPVVQERKGEFSSLFETLRKKGYQRLRIDQNFYDIDDDITLIKTNRHSISVVVDRLVLSRKQMKDESERKIIRSRLVQTLEETLKLAEGFAIVSFIADSSLSFPDKPTNYEDRLFSEKLACSNCGISISELEPRLFSFNSPQGACPVCNGLGSLLKINLDKILAPSLTMSEGAIIPFARVLSNDTWWARLVQVVVEEGGYDFRKTPFEEMSEEFKEILLHGSERIYNVTGENRFGRETMIQEKFEGFITNLERRYGETDSEFIRKEIEVFMQREICPSCNGARLKAEALSVHIRDLNISAVTGMTITRSLDWCNKLRNDEILTPKETIISQPILKEIISRLSFLSAVGLNYLTLGREAATLAGGEAQRIRLASQIGTGLTGVLYILDEPTIGLHQRDNDRLIGTLKQLRDKGNSVVVVEHDRDVMSNSDYVIDFGPLAGKYGGEIVAEGTPSTLIEESKSLTAKYLRREKDVKREHVAITNLEDFPLHAAIRIEGASHHNLKNVDVELPLRKLVVITGLSGSGKSTLLHDTLYCHLAKHLEKKTDQKPGDISSIMIPEEIKRVALIDQSPIGKTPRSNPATYTKIFDIIRTLFANSKESKIRGYNAGRFSFNVKGGRCEACQGDGQLKIEMQFLPDVYVTCDVCHGKRYNSETLEVKYKDKSIADVLALSVDEAFEFFKGIGNLRKKLQTLQEVGLGYVELGQPAPTLSGGEAQRVKLARELSVRLNEHVIYLLDEPTTGLHFADVQKLLNVLSQLVSQNNTVIVIEHNLDIIKNADYLVDLGPEGGEYGGEVIATGTPQQVSQNPKSFTGQYLVKEFSEMKIK